MSESRDKHTIFVVDDEEMLCRALVRVLRNPFHEVYFFNNPVEALARIDELSPALIISDNMMPKMTGFDFLRKVRTERPSIRTLMLTGGYITDEVRASLAAGEIDQMLGKPWRDDVLRATVQELLGERGWQQSTPLAAREAEQIKLARVAVPDTGNDHPGECSLHSTSVATVVGRH